MKKISRIAATLRGFAVFENILICTLLVLLAVLPSIEIIFRLVSNRGIAANSEYLPHLTLWIALIGGIIATRKKSHLRLSNSLFNITGFWRNKIEVFTSFCSVLITIILGCSSLSLSILAFDTSDKVGFIPIHFAIAILPIGFILISIRFIIAANQKKLINNFLILSAIPLGLITSLEPLINCSMALFPQYNPDFSAVNVIISIITRLRLPLTIIIVVSAFLGTPIFIAMGGFTILQFIANGGALEVVPDEVYDMLSQPLIPALPLFTFAGFVLSESQAGKRLIGFFQMWFSWFRGSLPIIAIITCAFFTTFTGASGVTILALGGLLIVILKAEGYREHFNIGLLTASGSIGLLFPPALPIIMYGVIAQIDIRKLFVGGVFPGLIMIVALAIFSFLQSRFISKPQNKIQKQNPSPGKFQWRHAFNSLRQAALELALPGIIIFLYFSGTTTLVETAAATVIYVLVVEMVIHKDISFKSLPSLLSKCTAIIGGVLMILAVSKSLSFLMIDAEIPIRLAEWAQNKIDSKFIFLLLLNLTLLVAGAFMDIFSAIVVLGPLLIPLGLSYDIHPVHLGIIFLANLELGFLTPPVGINLFLSSYRFEKDLIQIYRMVIPFFILLLCTVMIITYVPILSTGLLDIANF